MNCDLVQYNKLCKVCVKQAGDNISPTDETTNAKHTLTITNIILRVYCRIMNCAGNSKLLAFCCDTTYASKGVEKAKCSHRQWKPGSSGSPIAPVRTNLICLRSPVAYLCMCREGLVAS